MTGAPKTLEKHRQVLVKSTVHSVKSGLDDLIGRGHHKEVMEIIDEALRRIATKREAAE